MHNGSSGSGDCEAMDLHVQAVVRSAEREIRELLQQRAELMKRIGSIKQTLTGLANLFGDSVLSDELLAVLDRKSTRQSGFTNACRQVLMESPKALSARQVMERLEKAFPDLLGRHKEPMASITTVLTRLVEYSEARCYRCDRGYRVWEWASQLEATAVPIAVAAGEALETSNT